MFHVIWNSRHQYLNYTCDLDSKLDQRKMSNSASKKKKEFRPGITVLNNSAAVINRKFLNELLKYNNLNTVFAVTTGFEKRRFFLMNPRFFFDSRLEIRRLL